MKVLIADDDPITIEALDTNLKNEGFHTFAAQDGAEAMSLWERHRPDLLCLDIMMPKLDGFEVCRRIRAKDKTIPILFLSAKNEEIDVVLGLELGADDFIRKPFGKHELLARIRAVLRRTQSRGRPQRSILMRDLTVYPKELRAEREGDEIELTAREAAILDLLHEHAGCPVSRDIFLNQCWGLDYFPDSRTLDQHIAMLRKKIEREPTAPEIIETVRGVGYRFRPV